jgi:DNA-binding GntR family transcriptional regulator
MRDRLAAQVAHRIVEHIRERGLQAGHHLSAQELADLFSVSRAPVSAALRQLSEVNVVHSEPNRGYFVTQPITDAAPTVPPPPAAEEEDKLYFLIAEDRLAGCLPDRLSENEMIRRYQVPRKRLQLLLTKIADEGWVERRPGHGWAFGTALSSGEAYAKAYQFRASIESQAVLQPSFAIDAAELDAARARQIALLEGEMFTLPRERLFEINSSFHETIVSWSNNGFFLDALRRVNRLRRLMEYRVTIDRTRLARQCEEHLQILDKLASDDRAEAARFLSVHIGSAWSIKSLVVERRAVSPAPR